MTDIMGHGFKIVSKVTSGIRLRYLDLGPQYPLSDLGTVNNNGMISLLKKDGTTFEISEADFKSEKFILDTDGKIYYRQQNGAQVELKARRALGIDWGDLTFSGAHLIIKNKLDQLFASGKVMLGQPAGNRREVRYRQDPNSATFDPIGELENNGNVGTFENIGNNHSPGDVLLEYTADGEMAIVQNGNAKTIKVCGCLAAGTTIATPSGPVSIEQLQAGDNILSPEQNGQMTIATITQIVESAAVKMMRIFSGGSYMDLTLGHPVFSPALGRKISVDSLRAGMSLLALSGLLLTVDSVAAVHYPTPVYDLQTDAGRGYFAGVEELLVSSNQCNLYLSGRNFNASQIETIEEAVSTSIEAFISDIEHSADLLDFFREASGDVLRGKAEAWKLLHTLGEVRKTERLELQKVLSYLEQTNISQEDFIALYHAEPNKSQFFKRCKVVDNIDFLRPFRWFDAFRVDKPKVLILGEGNFTFSASISSDLPTVNRSNLLVTEYRSYDELVAANNIDQNVLDGALSTLQSNNIEYRFGIDGRNLPADIGNFDVILFNFPMIPGQVGIPFAQVNRDFLESVMTHVQNRLNPGGKLFLTQTPHWTTQIGYESLGGNTGFSLVGEKDFFAADFPGYSHVITNPNGQAANATKGVTFIFINQ